MTGEAPFVAPAAVFLLWALCFAAPLLFVAWRLAVAPVHGSSQRPRIGADGWNLLRAMRRDLGTSEPAGTLFVDRTVLAAPIVDLAPPLPDGGTAGAPPTTRMPQTTYQRTSAVMSPSGTFAIPPDSQLRLEGGEVGQLAEVLDFITRSVGARLALGIAAAEARACMRLALFAATSCACFGSLALHIFAPDNVGGLVLLLLSTLASGWSAILLALAMGGLRRAEDEACTTLWRWSRNFRHRWRVLGVALWRHSWVPTARRRVPCALALGCAPLLLLVACWRLGHQVIAVRFIALHLSAVRPCHSEQRSSPSSLVGVVGPRNELLGVARISMR